MVRNRGRVYQGTSEQQKANKANGAEQPTDVEVLTSDEMSADDAGTDAEMLLDDGDAGTATGNETTADDLLANERAELEAIEKKRGKTPKKAGAGTAPAAAKKSLEEIIAKQVDSPTLWTMMPTSVFVAARVAAGQTLDDALDEVMEEAKNNTRGLVERHLLLGTGFTEADAQNYLFSVGKTPRFRSDAAREAAREAFQASGGRGGSAEPADVASDEASDEGDAEPTE